jgi:hypothetical protein
MEPGCTSHPCVCADQACACQGPHISHSKLNIKGFELLLRSPVALPADLKQAEKTLYALTDALIASVNHLKQTFVAKLDAIMAQNYKQHQLRSKLVNGQMPTATEMTGNNIGQMLDEIKNGRDVKDIRVQPPSQLQEVTVSSLSKMQAIVEEVNRAWGLLSPSKT